MGSEMCIRDSCIINTASIVGLRPGPQPLPYSASKAAVISMTQSLSFALGPKVRVNAVALDGWKVNGWSACWEKTMRSSWNAGQK